MRTYQQLVAHVLEHGQRKENRTGVDTLSTFNFNFEVDMRDGFPLLTTKEISWKNIVIEMLWFLSGQTDISILKRHGCKFWDAWADPETGKVPSAYGNFWRKFPVHKPTVYGEDGEFTGVDVAYNDQIQWTIDELNKSPMSRRLVVSAWAPGNAQTSKLPPCHCLFILNVQNEDPLETFVRAKTPLGNDMVSRDTADTILQHFLSDSERREVLKRQLLNPDMNARFTDEDREYLRTIDQEPMTKRLCLHLTQRSCDVALGVPYNIASYGLLLHLYARFTGIEPGIFAHSLVDAHIYTSKPDGSMAEFDHVPGLREQLTRTPRPLPKLVISDTIKTIADIEALMAPEVTTEQIMSLFVLEGYDPHPAIPFRVAVLVALYHNQGRVPHLQRDLDCRWPGLHRQDYSHAPQAATGPLQSDAPGVQDILPRSPSGAPR